MLISLIGRPVTREIKSAEKSFMEHTFCVIYFFLLFTALFAAQLSILLMNLINHIRMPPTHWMVK